MRHRLLLSDPSRGPGSPGRGCRVPVAGQAVRPAASGPRLLRRPAHRLRGGRERERDRGARQLHLPPGRRHRGAGRNGDLRGRERPHPLRGRGDDRPRHPRRHDGLPVLPHRRRRRRGAARDGAEDGARLRAGAVRSRARHGDPARPRRRPAAARPPYAVRRPHPPDGVADPRREPERRRPAAAGALRQGAARRRRVRHAADAGSGEVPGTSRRAGARDVDDHAQLEGRRPEARRGRLPRPAPSELPVLGRLRARHVPERHPLREGAVRLDARPLSVPAVAAASTRRRCRTAPT